MYKYYVYYAYGVDNELLYIGKGSGDRYKHCNSGRSSSIELNRYYFRNGENNCITVKIVKYFNTNKEALVFEQNQIKVLKPLLNITEPPDNIKTKSFLEKLNEGMCVDFSKTMRLYIKSLENGDQCTIDKIESRNELHKQYVEVLGVDKIKAIGINKTKISNAYQLKLKFNENNFKIKSQLSGIKIGERYTLSEVIDFLQKSYTDVEITKKAKSTDIKNFFSVKDVFLTRDGKRSKGYLILDDLYKEIV